MSMFKGTNYVGSMEPKTGGFYGDYRKGAMGSKWTGGGNKEHSPKVSEGKSFPKFKFGTLGAHSLLARFGT